MRVTIAIARPIDKLVVDATNWIHPRMMSIYLGLVVGAIERSSGVGRNREENTAHADARRHSSHSNRLASRR